MARQQSGLDVVHLLGRSFRLEVLQTRGRAPARAPEEMGRFQVVTKNCCRTPGRNTEAVGAESVRDGPLARNTESSGLGVEAQDQFGYS